MHFPTGTVNISLNRDRRIYSIDLERTTRHCGLLGDATRLRLLALLEREELTVAELAGITRLAQPRVSTHLAKLRQAGLVTDRRDGVSVYYRLADNASERPLMRIWELLRDNLEDGQVANDFQRLPDILAARRGGQNWPDSVAGDMERHYSPGRTWETTTRALVQMLRPGRVLDIASGDGVMAELLSDIAERMDCVDLSPRVVQAGQQRLSGHDNVRFHQADMHALPFADGSFDTVLLMHALTYSETPQQAIAEGARVTRRTGRLIGATLRRHRHPRQVEPYGHVNAGFTVRELTGWADKAGMRMKHCAVSSAEKRPPHFEIITFLAEYS